MVQLQDPKEGPDLACRRNGREASVSGAEEVRSVRKMGSEQWAAGPVMGWKPSDSPQQRSDVV